MNYIINVKTPTRLSELIQKNHIHVSLPCGGCNGCGRCRVAVTGDISEISEKEKSLLSKAETYNNIRLACYTTVNSQCSVTLPDEIYAENKSEFACVDVGTTSIEVKYSDGTVIKLRNPQMSYGADVISRISNSEKYSQELNKCITDTLEILLKNCKSAVITGNTVMLSIICSKDISRIGKYPFLPETLFGYSDRLFETDVYFPPCADAFIGADIVCGVIGCGMTQSDTPKILCDTGTNTEIALWDGKKLYFASAPSSPAFEGGNISCGMTAMPGAVSGVYKDGYKLKYDTINNLKPAGICGSGLIEAVYFMKSERIINANGNIMDYGHRFPHLITHKSGEKAFQIGEIYITQSDIRNFQTAKSAVKTSVELLVREAGLNYTPDIILSGQFGTHIDSDKAVEVKMLPTGNFSFCSNAALDGAFKMKDEKYRAYAKELLKNSETIQLHNIESFPEKLAQNMNF